VSSLQGLVGYKQTTHYTCGPAALMALALHDKRSSIRAARDTEMRIAAETDACSLNVIKSGGEPGTKLAAVRRLLLRHRDLVDDDPRDATGACLTVARASRAARCTATADDGAGSL
jgi:hypothetical protein